MIFSCDSNNDDEYKKELKKFPVAAATSFCSDLGNSKN